MSPKKTWKPEAFDLMQYFYGSVHQPLIHVQIDFDGLLDEFILKQAVLCSLQAIPQLACRFDSSGSRPRWVQEDFKADDFVKLITAGQNPAENIRNALAETIQQTIGPQIKITLVRGERRDTLCLIINHMICDGAGMKEYLYLLASLYRKLKETPGTIPVIEPGSRDAKQVFHGKSVREKLGILFTRYDLSKQREQPVYSLQGDSRRPIFGTVMLESREFNDIRRTAKMHNFTVNDYILAAYFRILHNRTGAEQITLPCPVDLRKYLPKDSTFGISNLTSNYICSVTVRDGDSFEATARQVSEQIRRQKSTLGCLKSIFMLELAFSVIPYRALKKQFHRLFKIPVLSFSNLGILDQARLNFPGLTVIGAYMTGAIKQVPYFQIAASTFGDSCTLSCNLYGTPDDEREINRFLSDIRLELLRETEEAG